MVAVDEVFLPLEVVTREYAGKLLVALELANKGFRVVIGHKEPVKKRALTATHPGVFFFKSVPRITRDFFDTIRNRGFVSVVQDEEAGIIYNNFEEYYLQCPGLASFGDHDAFFCWGPDDFDFLRFKHAKDNQRLFLTGSARGFLWGDARGAKFNIDEIDMLRRRYAPYVLIVSNLAGVTGARGEEEDIAWLERGGYPAAVVAQARRSMDRFRRLGDAFVRASRAIHHALQINVVIRPHPGENADIWRQKVDNLNGVYVETKGELNSWIRGAEAVVQNGCTSAIEARLAGVAVFAFAETEVDLYEGGTFANRIAKHAVGIDTLVELLGNREEVWESFVATVPDGQLDRKVARPRQGAARAIAEVISNLAVPSGRSIEIHQTRNASSKPQSLLLQNKRRPITHKHILRDINKAAAALRIKNEFEVKQCAANCFAISKSKLLRH